MVPPLQSYRAKGGGYQIVDAQVLGKLYTPTLYMSSHLNCPSPLHQLTGLRLG